jgi:hypothetical protein
MYGVVVVAVVSMVRMKTGSEESCTIHHDRTGETCSDLARPRLDEESDVGWSDVFLTDRTCHPVSVDGRGGSLSPRRLGMFQ